jgi:hypothetical protein
LRDARRQAGDTPYVLYHYLCAAWPGQVGSCDETN